MRTHSLIPFIVAGAALGLAPVVTADVLYFGLQNIPIPTNFDGVYLNIDTGGTAFAESAGWDMNPAFGGAYVYNDESFQPARTGTGNEDAIIALGTGATVNASLNYSTGFGASNTHLGNGANQFSPGQEAYVGFSFTTDANAGPHFGWARVVFTANEPGGVIKDWAYETSAPGGTPTPIRTGNIVQAAPGGGVSVVTLTCELGEVVTLGSTLSTPGGAVTSLVKTGAGTWSISGIQTYTGETSVTGGTLLMGASNVIANTSQISLGGGEFATAGFSGTVGNLALLSSSVIDMGSGSSVLTFGNLDSADNWSGVLSVWNWSGGTDQLLFSSGTGNLSPAQLASIQFYSDEGTTPVGSGAGFEGNELVPVPEPGAVMAALLLMGVIGWRERRAWLHYRPVAR